MMLANLEFSSYNLNWNFMFSQNRLAVIKPTMYNPSDYDLVIIGPPIWTSRVSTPVRTYIEENKAKFKRAAYFCTALRDMIV
jgi:menaquinone-dependent protoporphyrinogen IX oxidase